MRLIYNLFVSLMVFGMKLFALAHPKTKRGVRGRKKSLGIVSSSFSPDDRVIWMHAASLGEYEQGLPVLEKLKLQYPLHKILITFFSPSGYDNVIKKKHIADAICYLPFDKRKEVEKFVSKFHTEIFFTVKYDYWYNLLEVLKQQRAKIFVISALFYEHQLFFENYGKWYVNQLKANVDWFFHQTKTSYALAKSIGLINASVSGDTRFDRVKQFLNRDNYLEGIRNFKNQSKLIVFGSSWQTEEEIAQILAKKFNNANVKIAVAPHDLQRVSYLKKVFPYATLYSSYGNDDALREAKVLIIDSIGKLSKLYSYADLAVVGGGFHSAGLHNILEAAVYGVPVIFGNQYKKNPEADALIEAGGAKSFEDFVEAAAFIVEIMKKAALDENSYLHEMAENAKRFVGAQPNSTEIIINKMNQLMTPAEGN